MEHQYSGKGELETIFLSPLCELVSSSSALMALKLFWYQVLLLLLPLLFTYFLLLSTPAELDQSEEEEVSAKKLIFEFTIPLNQKLFSLTQTPEPSLPI